MGKREVKGEDKEWARRYILDPLTAPEPSQLDGPGTSFFVARPSSARPVVPILHPTPFSPARRHAHLPTPDRSAHDPRPAPVPVPAAETDAVRFPFQSPRPSPRRSPSTGYRHSHGHSHSQSRHSCHSRYSLVAASATDATPVLADRTRSYLNRPLPLAPPAARSAPSMAPDATPAGSPPPPPPKAARSRRSRRAGRPLTDVIDSLDQAGAIYHHGGPYDATLAAVNADRKRAPVEAVRDSNREALRATPREYIEDSLTKHVPLQGTASLPPGVPDRFGRVLHYEEGADLMREPDAPGGAYRRYDGVPYHPDDLKGKGEPSFTIERALKENQGTGAAQAYEMQPRRHRDSDLDRDRDRGRDSPGRRRQTVGHDAAPPMYVGSSPWPDADAATATGRARSSSASHRLADGIKRRLGSLGRRV